MDYLESLLKIKMFSHEEAYAKLIKKESLQIQ